jgi:hypothetical protein
MERVKGIEPSYSAWEAAALPLSYTRNAFVNSARLGQAQDARFIQFTRQLGVKGLLELGQDHCHPTDRLCESLETAMPKFQSP